MPAHPAVPVLVLLVIALAGCSSSDLRQIGASHCHAEHVAKLVGTAWESQAKGSPQDVGTTRLYTWRLHRDGACVSRLDLAAFIFLKTNADSCGGVRLESTIVDGDLQLGPKTFDFNKPPNGVNETRSWTFGTGFDYPPDAPEGNPQSWVATMVLHVSHDDLVFPPSVDACVKNAIQVVTLEGYDLDFRA